MAAPARPVKVHVSIRPRFRVGATPPTFPPDPFMKTKPACFPLVLLALALFAPAWAAEPAAEASAPASQEPADPAPAEKAPAAPVSWAELKGATYDQRDAFLAGVKDLAAHVDQQIAELVAQRAAMAKANINTDAWDMLMQEITTARTNLKSTSDDMRGASRENWDQMKDQVGLAWERTQNAYMRVKASTTS